MSESVCCSNDQSPAEPCQTKLICRSRTIHPGVPFRNAGSVLEVETDSGGSFAVMVKQIPFSLARYRCARATETSPGVLQGRQEIAEFWRQTLNWHCWHHALHEMLAHALLQIASTCLGFQFTPRLLLADVNQTPLFQVSLLSTDVGPSRRPEFHKILARAQQNGGSDSTWALWVGSNGQEVQEQLQKLLEFFGVMDCVPRQVPTTDEAVSEVWWVNLAMEQGGCTWKQWMTDDWSGSYSQLCAVVFQLLWSLVVLYLYMEFVHGDLHEKNILIQTPASSSCTATATKKHFSLLLPEETTEHKWCIPQWQATPQVRLIDFGLSSWSPTRFRQQQQMPCTVIERPSTDTLQSHFVHDLNCLGHMLLLHAGEIERRFADESCRQSFTSLAQCLCGSQMELRRQLGAKAGDKDSFILLALLDHKFFQPLQLSSKNASLTEKHG